MRARVERDSLGKLQVPMDAYYGIFTMRALKNFQLTGQCAPHIFIRSLGLVKQACAEINFSLGLLAKREAKAIIQAAQEFSAGRFDDDFVIDVIQAGAGTPFNMNSNEIIANRANEILGKPLGSYNPIHPNNHVNMSQSTNDVIPTTIRIASLFLFAPLIDSLENLIKSFRTIAQKYSRLIKVGRTHLEDAVPITIGQEFHAYATMLEKTHKRFAIASQELLELGIGGTALGSGINTNPSFQKKVVAKLAELTRFPLKPTDDLFETTSSMNVFVTVSGACRTLAVDLAKIANDLKLLNMGPLAGIAEITLPEVEPGSSIMPGKVNPSIAEAVHMAAYDVMASDSAIMLAAQAGQLQLNVMTPLIMKHLLGSLFLLGNTCSMLQRNCVDGLVINERTVRRFFENSLVTATALAPYLGYEVVAQIVKEALKSEKSIIEVVQKKGFVEDLDLKTLLSADRTTKPSILDHAIKKRIEKNAEFQKYRASLAT